MKRRLEQLAKQVQCAGLTAAVLLTFSGCGAEMEGETIPMQEENLMADIQGDSPGDRNNSYSDRNNSYGDRNAALPENTDIDRNGAAAAVTDFGLRLFRNNYAADKNVLISPLSVISALAMTANGAEGETLRQMEESFGISVPELDIYLAEYMEALPDNEKYKLSMADGIWFKDSEEFHVEQDFLQKNADYFDTELYKVPFDNDAIKQINNWVKDNTDGMIEQIVDRIPQAAVMYLVNALAFDAEWEDIYRKDQVRELEFTKEDGTVQKVDFMYSSEYHYLEDGQAEGFLKYYADRKYAFAALLPEEGVAVSEYLVSLTGEKLREILTNPVQIQVYTLIPKFECQYSAEMNEALQKMGIKDAFSPDTADFTGIGTYGEDRLYISRVLHKSYIAVDERGTRAGAATAVEMNAGAAAPGEVRTVHLDRPFVYMIIDCESKIPIFMGAVMDMEQQEE